MCLFLNTLNCLLILDEEIILVLHSKQHRSCLYVISFSVIANIGHSTPKLDNILDVSPVFVYAIIAFAFKFAANVQTE